MIKIISFVDSFKHYKEPIDEFLKRLWKEIVFVKLKPSKKKEVKEIIKEETILLKKNLEKEKWFKILLCIDWNQLDTLEFAKMIEEKRMKHSNITFVIWWAYWVNFEEIKEFINYKFSFSKMTFPHSQAIMMLLEQVYRASCIKKWIKYHH